MKKFAKSILVIALAVVAAASIAVFASACGSKVPDGYVRVRVVDENGNVVKGDGNISVQFCLIDDNGTLGACTVNETLGEDGKVDIEVAKIFTVPGITKAEVHILNVAGYKHGNSGEENGFYYGRYNKSSFPTEIEVMLEKA